MAKHEIKIKTEFFKEITQGNKTFEIRNNDIGYEVDDVVILYEIKNQSNFDVQTGGFIILKITYILHSSEFIGLKEGFCIFSFKILDYYEK